MEKLRQNNSDGFRTKLPYTSGKKQMKVNEYIVENRAHWDAEHPKHDVVIRDFYDKIIKIIPNDNSTMDCYGIPMWTPQAVEFLSQNPFAEDDEIYSIDGKGGGWEP